MDARAPSRRYDSVQQDWRAFLPESKAALFDTHTRDLETSYLAFSVSLNAAMELRDRHLGVQTLDTIAVSSELCSRLALRIGSVLHSMRQRGRHFGILPNFTALEPANFQTERGQRAARSSNLVGRILLSRHAQFLHKIFTLERVVDVMEQDFSEAIGQAGEADWLLNSDFWHFLDMCHFDLNTCLRETMVLFKSFLFVLPEDQLDGLDFIIRGLCRSRHVGRETTFHIIRPRRMTAVAGK